MKYWDASGIVPLLVRQALTRDLERLLAQDPAVVSWWDGVRRSSVFRKASY